MSAPGVVLNRRYRLGEQIAAGGMGEVWRASDEVLGRAVAVKLLRNAYTGDEAFRARFRAEARFAASLSHPGIAQVFDYGEQDDDAFRGAYLVMELVDGEPLSQLLARNGRLSAEVALDIVAQAARALQVAHAAGIIHRDIKPGNLLVTSEGRVKITDFGIARAEHAMATSLTQTGMVMGTAQYVSPEQASGQRLTPAADIYSLGVVAYECLAGRPPFHSGSPITIALGHVRETPPPLPADVPPQVRDLVAETLAKNPAQRPSTARELADRALVLRESLPLDSAETTGLAGIAVDDPVAWFSEEKPTSPGRVLEYEDPGEDNDGPADDGSGGPPPVPPQRARRRRRAPRVLALALVACLVALGGVVISAMVNSRGAATNFEEGAPVPSVSPSGRSTTRVPAVLPGRQQPPPSSAEAPTPAARPSESPSPTASPTPTARPTPDQTPTETVPASPTPTQSSAGPTVEPSTSMSSSPGP